MLQSIRSIEPNKVKSKPNAKFSIQENSSEYAPAILKYLDIDPKGTGVLSADDIPTALSSAACIFRHRLDPHKAFPIVTSRKRIYFYHKLNDMYDSPSCEPTKRIPRAAYPIIARTHSFDQIERKTKSPKRKTGTISKFSQNSRGAQGVFKIFPNCRTGFAGDNTALTE